MIHTYILLPLPPPQVPSSVATKVLTIFESLSFLSSTYGLLDFLRGQEPLLCPSDALVVNLPAPHPMDGDLATQPNTLAYTKVLIHLNTTDTPEKQCQTISEAHPSLSPLHLLRVRHIVNAAHGLRLGMGARVRLLALRMRALYVLFHSHLPVDALQSYFQPESKLIKDLLILADVSSTVMSALAATECPYPVASLALDCLGGLLEVSTHRRKYVLRESGILQSLGIIRSDATAGAAQELPWLSVLLSACTIITTSFEESGGRGSSVNEIVVTNFPNVLERSRASYVAEYVQMAVDLLSTCLSVRDHCLVNESTAIGAIINLIQASLGRLRVILTGLSGCESETPAVVYDVFPVVKALQCLDVAVTGSNTRSGTFREHNGLSMLSQLFELFSAVPCPLLFRTDTVLNELLVSALGLLTEVIGSGRRRVVLATESGIQILYQPQFMQLCHVILGGRRDAQNTICITLLQYLCELFAAAIDIEPQFLAHFLRSTIAEELLVAAVSDKRGVSALVASSAANSCKSRNLFLPVLRLAQSMCITSDGRECITSKDVLPKLIRATVHDCHLFPKSEGTLSETLTGFGNELGQMLRDNELLRSGVLEALKSCMMRSCQDAALDVEAVRCSAMQRIINIATIVEAINISRRSATISGILRKFFVLEVLDNIVRAFQFTLPSSRQLFAQITSHHPSVHTPTHYGDFFAAKSLSALVKLASSVFPQLVLPVLFASVDTSLADISAAKEALVALSKMKEKGVSAPCDGSVTTSLQEGEVSQESKDSVPILTKKAYKRKKRSSSSPPNVDVLGVLDCVPDKRIYVSDYAADMQGRKGPQREEAIADLVRGVLALEWKVRMICQCLKSGRFEAQGADPHHITSGKDVLRRVFAFHRSSLLEICRVASHKWTPQPLSKCRSKLSGNFELSPPGETSNSAQPANLYKLRITISSGAVVRDGFDIDNSRIVFLAPYGATASAYERICTTEGVVRYRTAHGWLSEFQRDVSKDPIVTIEDTLLTGDGSVTSTVPANQTVPMMCNDTLRDGVSYTMTRVHNALKALATQLSQSLVSDADGRHSHSSAHISPIAPLVATSLSKITAKFFENPIGACGGAKTCVWPAPSLGRSASDDDLMRADLVASKYDENCKRGIGSGGSESGMDDGEGRDGGVEVDEVTVNLFLGATAKFILNTFEEKGGHSNTYLLKRMLAHGVVHGILNSFCFLVDIVANDLSKLFPNGKVDPPVVEKLLSASARCALHCIPHYHALLLKLSNYDHFRRSPVTALMVAGGQDGSDSELDQLLQKGLMKVGRALLPLYESNCFSFFPTDIQTEWMTIVVALSSSIKSIHLAATNKSRRPDRFDSAMDRFSAMERGLPPRLVQRAFEANARQRAFETNARQRAMQGQGQQQQQRGEDVVDVAIGAGFTRGAVLHAIAATGQDDLDSVMNFLFSHFNEEDSATRGLFRTSSRTTSGLTDLMMREDRMSGDSPPQGAVMASASQVVAGIQSDMPAGENDVDSSDEERSDDDYEEQLAAALALSTQVEDTSASSGAPPTEDVTSTAHAENSEDREVAEISTLSVSPATGENSTPSGSSDLLVLGDEGTAAVTRTRSASFDPSIIASSPEPPEQHTSSVGPLGLQWGDTCQFEHDAASVLPKSVIEDPKILKIVDDANELLASFGNGIVPYVTAYWKHTDFAFAWSEHAVQAGFARLCAFLLKMKSCFPNLDQSDILHDLVSRLKMGDTEGLRGVLLFFLSLLRSHQNRQLLEHAITSSLADEVVSAICGFIRDAIRSMSTHGDAGTRDLPGWVSISLLVCYDLVMSRNYAEVRAQEALNGFMSPSSESKQDDTMLQATQGDAVDDGEKSLMSDQRGAMERHALVSEECKRDLFRTVQKLLSLSSDTHIRPVGEGGAPSRGCLDGSTCQALMMLLSALLSCNEIANIFVKSGGLDRILSLPADDTKNIFLQPVLSLIVRRCLETQSMLKLCMRSEIKAIVKQRGAGGGAVPSLIPREFKLSDFLDACSHLIARDPELFVTTAQSVVSYKQLVPSQGTLVVQPIVVELRHDVDDDLCGGDDSDPFPGSRALKTISILVTHIVSDENRSDLVFSRGNCLQAFADCALSLKGVPQLIAKCHVDASPQSGLLFPWLIQNIFARNCGDSKSDIAVISDVQAATRLIAAVSSHRGSPRRAVLDSLVASLQRVCDRTSLEQTVCVDEATRLCYLTRIGKLLSIVVTATKQPKEAANHDGSPRAGQNISIESLFYLSNASTAFLLSKALASIVTVLPGSEGVFDSLMSPLEMLTRTKFLEHWSQLKAKAVEAASASRSDDAAGQATSTSSETAANHSELMSNFMALHEDRVMEAAAAVAGDANAQLPPLGHDNDSAASVDDGEDGDDHVPEEEDDDEDEDDDENEDVDEEEDSDDDDDDDDGDDVPRIDFDLFGAGSGRDVGRSMAELFALADEDDMHDVLDNIQAEIMSPLQREMLEPGRPGPNYVGNFVTPPEQMRNNPRNGGRGQWGMSVHEEVETAEYGNTLFEFIRRTAGSSHLQSRAPTSSNDISGEPYPGVNPAEEELLPGGIDQALQVNWNIGHPLLPMPREEWRRGGDSHSQEGERRGGRVAAWDDPSGLGGNGGDFFETMLGVDENGMVSAESLVLFPRSHHRPSWLGVDRDGRDGRDVGLRRVDRRSGTDAPSWRGELSPSRPVGGTHSSAASVGWLTGSAQGVPPDVLQGVASRLRGMAVLEEVSPAVAGDAVALTGNEEEAVAANETNILILSDEYPGGDGVHDGEIMGVDPNAPGESGPRESNPSAVGESDPRVIGEGGLSTIGESDPSSIGEGSPRDTLDMSQIVADMGAALSSGGVENAAAPVAPDAIAAVAESNVDAEVALSENEVDVVMPVEESATADHGAEREDVGLDAHLLAIINSEETQREQVEESPGATAEATGDEPVDVPGSGAAEGGLVCPPGYDAEVFNSLPEFMQQEIIETYQETTDQTSELLLSAGYDMETINALPESIRQEILDQVRREREQQAAADFNIPPDPSLAQEMDNSSFLTSLTPELRQEVLLTSDAAFIATLTPELMAEAQLVRERAAHRWNRMEMMAAAEPRARSSRGADVPDEGRDEQGLGEQTAEEDVGPQYPGKMRLCNGDVEDIMVPPDVVAVLLRVLFYDKLPVSSRHIHRLVQNMCKHPLTREVLLKVIVALLSDLPREAEIFRQMSAGELELGDSFPPHDLIVTSTPSPSLGVQDEAVTRKPLPSLVGKRLIATLINICSANESVIYDILRVRCGDSMLEQFCRDDDDVINVDVAALPPSQCGSPRKSFLEMIIRLLDVPTYTSTTPELLQLTKLISSLCEPLEILAEVEDNSLEDEKMSGEDDEAREVVGNYSWVRVPPVGLSRTTLRCLCDALLNEACTKEVFDHVISTISRLAYVKCNRSILMEVVVEVLVDLAAVSCSRMQDIAAHLKAAKGKGDESPSSRAALSIPMGDVGTQDHARVLRALQTLQSLSLRTNHDFADIAPMDELQQLWSVTDKVLRYLGMYVEAEAGMDEEGKPATKRQQHAALSAVLSRLLPVIEGFFLVHAGDILRSAATTAAKETTGPESPEREDTKDGNPPAPSLRHVSSFGDGIQLTRQQSLPGAKYRQSADFQRANLSLSGDNIDDIGRLSFRRTHSLISVSSTDGASMSGLALTRSEKLLAFVHTHKNILNILLRSFPSLLDDSLEALIRISQLRSYLVFDVKRAYFHSQLKKRRNQARRERTIHLQVRRDNVFEDSFHQLRFRTPEEMRGRLVVNFHDEEGIDAGGLTREWYLVLSREIFNPNYCLFTGAADGATFQPNPLSNINTNHLDYFKFVGRVIGKAVVDGHLLDGHFTR